MRQIWIPKIGGPEVLELREAPDPQPGAGEVRIRVQAAGINFADILARQGLYPDSPKLPAVVGYEVAGTIDQVGAEVKNFQEGNRVGAVTRFGGYSDVVVVPEASVFPLPGHLSFEEGAAIPVNYLTAYLMLIHQGNLKEKEKVLIHAVAGGVGQAATQLCKWKGAEIFGTASASKHARLKELGVHHCIDYHSEDFEKKIMQLTKGRGVDIVLDAVGGDSFKKSHRCLAPLGKLFMFGISSFSTGKKRSLISALKGYLATPTFKVIPLINKNLGVFGFNLGHLWQEKELLTNSVMQILQLMVEDTLHPLVDQSFPFNKAAEAHAYIQDHKNFSKVVLVP